MICNYNYRAAILRVCEIKDLFSKSLSIYFFSPQASSGKAKIKILRDKPLGKYNGYFYAPAMIMARALSVTPVRPYFTYVLIYVLTSVPTTSAL